MRRKGKKPKQKPVWHILVILTAILLLINYCNYLFKNSAEFIYPISHDKQPSPRNYVCQKRSSIPSNLLPEVIENGPRNKKQVALTFDADLTYGMLDMLKEKKVATWYDKRLKEYLEENKIKSTIFVTGLWVETYKDAAREIAASPLFEIGNHSYSHPAFAANCFGLPLIERDNIENEVETAQKTIISITKISPRIFRFPGGCYEKIDLKSISKYGMRIVQWDTVAGDAFNQNAQNIIHNVTSRVQNGSIVVMHFNNSIYSPKTLDAIKEIVPHLKKQGFEFVKVSDLIESTN